MAKQASRRNERGSLPAWLWLILGAALGVALSVAVLYGGKLPVLRGDRNLPQPNPDATAPPPSEAALADAAPKAPPKSGYDFYNVLPEKEVVIPDAELSAKARAEQQRQQQAAQAQQPDNAAPGANANGATPTTAPSTPPAGGARYMLQVAATGDAKAADELKAKLALLGFNAKVYTSTTSEGKTLHRVRLGPFASASETETSKKALADNGVNAIPVKEGP